MASEIAGLFMTPEQYQMLQQQSMEKQAADYASLNPIARGEYSAYLAGGQIGQGLRNFLGTQDPQLRLISQRQQLSQGIDPADPNSILMAAQRAAELGDQQFALALADYGRKASSEMALAQQRAREGRVAGIPKELQIAQARAELLDRQAQLEALPDSEEKARALGVVKNTLNGLTATARQGQIPDSIEIARELALEKGPEGSDAYTAAFRKELRSLTEKKNADKQLEQSKLLVEAGYEPGSEDYKAKMRQFVEAEITGKGKGKGTQVDIGGIRVDTGKAGEAAGKKVGEELIDVKGKQAAIDSIRDAKALLGPNGEGVYAGAYGPTKQFVAKFTGVGSSEKAARTEEFLAYIGETVVPRLKEFGGNDSEQELAYLNKITGGDISMEPKALVRILNTAEKKIQRGIERLRQQAETAETKKPLTSLLPRKVDNVNRPSEPAATMPTAPVAPAARASAAPAATAKTAQPTAPAKTAKTTTGAPKATKRWNPQTRKIEVIQ